MPTDIYQQFRFNNAQGVDPADLNLIQKFADAKALDQILSRYVGALGSSSLDPDLASTGGENPALTSLIYTLTGGDAIIKQGTTATRVGLTSGTIFQKIGNAGGEDASFLSYFVDESDVDLTISAGHATLPRIDILQCKLEYVNANSEERGLQDATTRLITIQSIQTQRKVQATFSIKAGTAGATPTYPAPDTGYALLASIRVPATWTTGTTPDGTGSSSLGLRQCTMPLRTRTVSVSTREMIKRTAGNWTYSDPGGIWACLGAPSTDLLAPCPAGINERIIGVGIFGAFGAFSAAANSVILQAMAHAGTGYNLASTPSNDLTVAMQVDGGTSQGFTFAHLGMICDTSSDSNPTAANGVIGDPFWAWGGKAGPAWRPNVTLTPPSTTNLGKRAVLRISGETSTIINEVMWFLAG
jgi:hypothetical protein